jgi:aminoglycoside phosphotransferase (APT) family kinase protein
VELDHLEKIGEGREAEIFAWEPGTVLRLYRDGEAKELAERERVALSAVHSALEAVPEVRGEISLGGRPGLLMERLDGTNMLVELARRPWRLLELARLTGRLHAELHRIEAPPELPSLREKLERELRTGSGIPERLCDRARRTLEGLGDGDRLCHGDYWPGNVLLTTRGPVVIDWADATRGDAAGDLARTSLMMRVGSLPPGTPRLVRATSSLSAWLFGAAYRRAYDHMRAHDARTAIPWRFVRAAERLGQGIPEERDGLLRELERLDPRLDDDPGAGSGSAVQRGR